MGKLAGPLLDRVDLQLQVSAVSRASLLAPGGESSAQVAARVVTARGLQAERLANTPWRLNADVPGPMMREGFLKLPASATKDLERALERGVLTLRGYDRVLKVVRKVTDLEGVVRRSMTGPLVSDSWQPPDPNAEANAGPFSASRRSERVLG
jgi:magnesium chelatase family protein